MRLAALTTERYDPTILCDSRSQHGVPPRVARHQDRGHRAQQGRRRRKREGRGLPRRGVGERVHRAHARDQLPDAREARGDARSDIVPQDPHAVGV